MVCNEEQPEAALGPFMKLLIPVTNKHAPIKKTVTFPWIDKELNSFIVEWHKAKGMAKKSCKLRNHVTKLIEN